MKCDVFSSSCVFLVLLAVAAVPPAAAELEYDECYSTVLGSTFEATPIDDSLNYCFTRQKSIIINESLPCRCAFFTQNEGMNAFAMVGDGQCEMYSYVAVPTGGAVGDVGTKLVYSVETPLANSKGPLDIGFSVSDGWKTVKMSRGYVVIDIRETCQVETMRIYSVYGTRRPYLEQEKSHSQIRHRTTLTLSRKFNPCLLTEIRFQYYGINGTLFDTHIWTNPKNHRSLGKYTGYVEFHGYSGLCYGLTEIKGNYRHASTVCSKAGSSLIRKPLDSNFRRNIAFTTTAWVKLRNFKSESIYKWTNGRSVTYDSAEWSNPDEVPYCSGAYLSMDDGGQFWLTAANDTEVHNIICRK